MHILYDIFNLYLIGTAIVTVIALAAVVGYWLWPNLPAVKSLFRRAAKMALYDPYLEAAAYAIVILVMLWLSIQYD